MLYTNTNHHLRQNAVLASRNTGLYDSQGMPGNTYYSQGWPSDRNLFHIPREWHLTEARNDANLDVYGAQGVADNTHGKKSLETDRTQVPKA